MISEPVLVTDEDDYFRVSLTEHHLSFVLSKNVLTLPPERIVKIIFLEFASYLNDKKKIDEAVREVVKND